MKTGLGILCGVLLIGNIFWASLYFVWHAEALKLRENQDAVEEKAERAERSKSEVTKNVQAIVDSREIAGVYRFWSELTDRFQRLDLRSDGTGKYDSGSSNGFTKPANWHKNVNDSISVEGHGIFKIEKDDLIDQRGNRWIHIR